MKSDGMRLGFLAGVVAGCILVVLFLWMTKKDGSIRCKYDERQQLVRGRGFQYGFFSWMIFNGIEILLDVGFEKQYMDTSMSLYFGMVVGVAVYVSYNIWHDGYFSLNENPKRAISLLVAMTVLNGACGAFRVHEGLLENGVLTLLNGANLLLAVAMLLILSVLFVKWHSDQKRTE